MGRLPRPTGDDLIYHAINRGNNRADVLGPERERDMFLGDLARTKARYPFALFGYSLMSNHFRQFGVSSSLLLPLHQVGKLDSWEDFQDRQAMTLFTTRSTAGTTEPMSSAPTANGICSLAISPAPRHGTLSRSSATA